MFHDAPKLARFFFNAGISIRSSADKNYGLHFNFKYNNWIHTKPLAAFRHLCCSQNGLANTRQQCTAFHCSEMKHASKSFLVSLLTSGANEQLAHTISPVHKVSSLSCCRSCSLRTCAHAPLMESVALFSSCFTAMLHKRFIFLGAVHIAEKNRVCASSH